MNERVDRLRARLDEPLLVTNGANVRYLSGLASSNAALLVEPERVRLFTDFRYASAARALPGAEVVETRRSLVADLAELLEGRIAFEADDVRYSDYETLAAGGLELVPRRGTVETLRAVKDEAELDALRRAARITTEAYAGLAEEQFVGRPERELAWRMEQLLHDLGAERTAFPIIVAGGPNGARPHATSGDRRIEAGETVVIDAGCVADGYSSDCTRTFLTGELPAELERGYDVCLDAQLAAVDAVRAGANARAVDAVARDRIAGAGLGDAFGHALGHGVGLLVHEAPRLSPLSPEDETLAAGNVVTVEPGIYLEGVGGVRIEDLVAVTEDGPEVLTSFPKEPLTVR